MGKKGQPAKSPEEPQIDFESISKDLADIEHKQHIDQIGPAITEVYLNHAKYTDDKGVVRFKTKFTKDEGKKIAQASYDALAYHTHRRVFGIDKETYQKLASYKDPNGNPYIDTVTQTYFGGFRRKELERVFTRHDENEISVQGLQKILENPINKHLNLLVQNKISKHGLDDPKHSDAVKKAIDNIVEKYHLPKKRYNTKDMHSPDEIISTYVQLAQEHYRN